MNNFEKIRTLSLDELAKFMDVSGFSADVACDEMIKSADRECTDEQCIEYDIPKDACVKCFKKWLLREAKQ